MTSRTPPTPQSPELSAKPKGAARDRDRDRHADRWHPWGRTVFPGKFKMRREVPGRTVDGRWPVGGVVAAAFVIVASCGTAFAGALPPVTHRPPAAEVPAAGVPAAGVPAAGVPAAGVPAAGVPAAGVPAAGVTVRAGQAAAGMGRSSNHSRSGQDGYNSTGRLPASRLVSSSTPGARASLAFGPTSGMHVEVEGTASTGYRAVIYDGGAFVAGRGMVGPWDVTVLTTTKGRRKAPCTVGNTTCRATHLQNEYTKLSYSPGSRTLTLSGAINTVQGATVSRFESYRFVDKETMASIVGIQSNKAIDAWYSPYTDFPPNWRPMWAGGYAPSVQQPDDH